MVQTSNPRYRTGINDLLDVAARRQVIPMCVAADDTTRSRYTGAFQESWVLGLLHSGAAPDHLGEERLGCLERAERRLFLATMLSGPFEPTKEALLWKNLTRILKAIESGELVPIARFDIAGRPYKREVDLGTILDVLTFHDWSVRVELPVIGPWPTRGEAIDRGGVIRQYPHETRLLRVQEEVAWRCQKLVAELGHWPHNDTVAKLVREYGVNVNPADVIASILRPNHLRPGRPPGSGSTLRPERRR